MFQAYFEFLYRIVTAIPFSPVDIVLVVLAIFYIKQEQASGLPSALGTFLSYSVVFLGTVTGYPLISGTLGNFLSVHISLADCISVLICIMLLYIIVTTVRRTLSVDIPRFHQRVESIAYPVGALSFFLLLSLITTMLLLLPLSAPVKKLGVDSLLARNSTVFFSRFEIKIGQITRFRPNAAANVYSITTRDSYIYREWGPEERIEFNEEAEREYYEVIQQERASQKLALFQHDSHLTTIARDHAVDLARSGMLSTLSTRGFSVYDRLQSEGYYYMSASEVVLKTYSKDHLAVALKQLPSVSALMRSPNLNKIGIAVVDTGTYGNVIIIDLIQ